ncbi:D-ribose pyranase [Cryobacterium breve]|uniref:D-ribose pyranase n=1 Tax=Cryobacterium breve TaxID=1259258 RepID=A0ABY7N9X0_9MICO|nr:D-ribose pyranase [Cryobacterium breve]WBM79307.1 D-ribose pyranase [Cryobacterium breve]
MKLTSGIIHPQLSRVIAECGHTDAIVVADAGLPIPPNVERIDLAHRAGSPAFLDILDTVLGEFIVERAVVSEEIEANSPGMLTSVRARLEAVGVVVEAIPHDEFKARTQGARAIVRTGEYTPYSNVMLYSGAPF